MGYFFKGIAIIAVTTISWSTAQNAVPEQSPRENPTVNPPRLAPNITEANVEAVTAQYRSCCRVLTQLIGDYTFQAGESYAGSLKSYWTLQEQSIKPSCIVIPRNTQEVADVVLSLTLASKHIEGQCPFAVRGGGHTPWPGAANIQDGVTIDLSSLNQVDVSPDSTFVSIGPGNRWGNVYQKLDALELATSGGRVASVGVGGLILGGGISFFSPRVGLVCDNVLNYEIVLASGEIANINATSNKDLFRALKGGSNNFGIVTRFDMKVFPQGKFWGGFLVNPIQVKDQFFKLFETFATSKGYDPYAALINSYSYSPARGGWTIASNIEYTKPEVNATVFKPFLALPSIASTMRISNLTDFTVELTASSPPGGRASFATTTFKNSARTMSQIFDLANATALTLDKVSDIGFSISFQPLPQATLSPGFATTAGAGNALGLSAEDGDLVNVLLTVQWSNAADDIAVGTATKDLFAQIEKMTKAEGTYHPYLYLNYAAEWQKPIAGYKEEQVRFLQGVSKKVDPGQVFQKLVPGGFKLEL